MAGEKEGREEAKERRLRKKRNECREGEKVEKQGGREGRKAEREGWFSNVFSFYLKHKSKFVLQFSFPDPWNMEKQI